MLKRSTLLNYQNGNISDLTRIELIQLVRYFENGKNDEIEEDIEEDD